MEDRFFIHGIISYTLEKSQAACENGSSSINFRSEPSIITLRRFIPSREDISPHPNGRKLDLDRTLNCLSLLLLSCHSLGPHDTTTPVASVLLVLVVEAVVDGADELAELVLVLLLDLRQGDNSGRLLVDNRAEPGLTLDDGVRNAHFPAESGQVDDQLDGINVVGDQHESGLLVLNQTDNVVETVLDSVWLLADILLLLAFGDGGGLLLKTLLLLGLGLWTVLVEKLQGLSGRVSVQSVLELGDRRWDLESQVEDLLLSLKSDILWPSNCCQLVPPPSRVFPSYLTMRERFRRGWTS